MSDVTIENNKDSLKNILPININGDKTTISEQLKSIKVENDANVKEIIQNVENVVLNDLIKNDHIKTEQISDLLHEEKTGNKLTRAIKNEFKNSQKLILTKRDLKCDDSDRNYKNESKSSTSSDSEPGSSSETGFSTFFKLLYY